MAALAGGALVTCCRLLAILALVAAFLVFLFGAFNGVALWWYNTAPWGGDNPAWQIKYNALANRYEEAGATIAPLTYGGDTVQVFCMGAGTVVAALATFVLRGLPRTATEGHSPTFLGKSGMRLKQALLFQLPPRRFWLWWCGGVHVLDLCLILATEATVIIADSIDYGTFEDSYGEIGLHMAKVEAVGNRTGWLALAGALVLFYPVPRNSFLQHLFGVDFSYLIKYHRWAGHFTMLGTAIHGFIYYVAWGIESRFAQQFRTWQIYTISNLAGNLSFIFGLILWATSLQFVRRHYFEIFYRFHMLGFIGFYVFGFLHYNGLWTYSGPGFVLYLLDVTFRLAQWMNVSIITGSLVAHDLLALQLNFQPSTKLKPNSFVFLSIPDASRAEWHPFTLSIVRNSTDPTRPAQATVFIKPYGRWAQSLVRRIAEKGSALVKIDGPYGGANSLTDINCPVAVIFAGGIGVTPMLGLLASMRESRQLAKANGGIVSGPLKVYFIWSSRSAAMFDLLDEDLLATAREPGTWLDIELHSSGTGPDTTPHNGHGGHNGFPVNGEAKEAMVSLQRASMEAPNGAAIPPQTIAKFEHPELKLASPFFLKPSLLQSYGIGYPLWGLAHILAFVGAYFGTFMASAYNAVDTAVKVNGPTYWVYNLTIMVGLFVGAMGFPALLIFPVFLWRRYRSQKVMANGGLNAPGLLPSWRDQADHSKTEAASRAAIRGGRPNIRSILKNVQANHPDVSEIHVCAAGPPGMVKDIKLNCADLSSMWGSGTRFVCEVDSFAL